MARKEKALCKGFANRLKIVILEAGIKKMALAKVLGVVPTTISAWLGGVNEPELSMVVKIAEALNVSCDWLLRGSNRDLANSRLDDLVARVTRIERELFG